MKNFRTTVFLRKLMLVNVCLFFAAGCKRPVTPQSKPHPLAVRVQAAREGSIRETTLYVGTMHSQQEIRILARIAGKVADLPVQEGADAVRGAVLARIATPEMDARVGKLKAELARASAESAFACAQAKTDQQLLRKHAISPIRAEAGEMKCKSSRAGLNAIRAGLKEIRLVAGRSQEKAPFAGRVLQWIARPGENIMPGRPILMFGGKAMEVRVMVQEEDTKQRIRTGQEVILGTDNGQKVRARVNYVAPMAVGPGRLVEVRISVADKQVKTLGLAHGMSVNVRFVTAGKDNTLIVPESAIRTGTRGAVVFKVSKNIAREIPVKTGIRQGDAVAITTGALKTGDLVITGNLDVVKDGLIVYPVKHNGAIK